MVAKKRKTKKRVSKVKKPSNPKIRKGHKPPNPKITKSKPKVKKKRAKRTINKYPGVPASVVRRAQQRAAKEAERIKHLSKEDIINEYVRTLQLLDVLRETAHWVPYHEPEQLHLGRRGHQAYPKGSIALQPSRARLLPSHILDELMATMRKKYRESEDALDDYIHELSSRTDFTIRELYTLWFSP